MIWVYFKFIYSIRYSIGNNIFNITQSNISINNSIFIVHFRFFVVYKAKCHIGTASDTDGYSDYPRVNSNYTLYT